VSGPEDEEETLSDPTETPDESTGDALEGVDSDDINSGDEDLPEPPAEGIPGD
jgi:hypothetical protein